MGYIPLNINLQPDQPVVVIGGGKVAERRLQTILQTAATVTIISPHVTDRIRKWAETGKLDWQRKSAGTADLEDAFLIILATNHTEINRKLREAAPKTALINDTGNADAGNTTFPSYFERNRMMVSVTTNGASPMLARKVKEQLENSFPADYGNYIDFLYQCRQLIKQSSLNQKEKREILQAILSEDYQQEGKQIEMLKYLNVVKRMRLNEGTDREDNSHRCEKAFQ